MTRQTSAGRMTGGVIRSMKGVQPELRVTRTQLRDPNVLEMASHGVVEVMTGGEDNVAMIPWQSLVDLRSVLDLARSFVEVTVAIGHPNIPRALLGEFAFILDLHREDRDRFLGEFGEAVAESIRLGDPRPAAFLTDAYRYAAGNPAPKNPMFSGEVSEDVDEVLASKLSRR